MQSGVCRLVCASFGAKMASFFVRFLKGCGALKGEKLPVRLSLSEDHLLLFLLGFTQGQTSLCRPGILEMQDGVEEA